MTSRVTTLYNIQNVSASEKLMRHAKRQESMSYLQKKKLIKTLPEEADIGLTIRRTLNQLSYMIKESHVSTTTTTK